MPSVMFRAGMSSKPASWQSAGMFFKTTRLGFGSWMYPSRLNFLRVGFETHTDLARRPTSSMTEAA